MSRRVRSITRQRYITRGEIKSNSFTISAVRTRQPVLSSRRHGRTKNKPPSVRPLSDVVHFNIPVAFEARRNTCAVFQPGLFAHGQRLDMLRVRYVCTGETNTRETVTPRTYFQRPRAIYAMRPNTNRCPFFSNPF